MVNIKGLISDMGKRLFPEGPKQKIPRQDGCILYMYARDFLVWSCLAVLLPIRKYLDMQG